MLAFILILKTGWSSTRTHWSYRRTGRTFPAIYGRWQLTKAIAYTCLVLSGTSAIHFFAGGVRSYGYSSLIGLNKGFPTDSQEAIADRWALQLGVVFGWLDFWTLPLIREVVWVKNPT